MKFTISIKKHKRRKMRLVTIGPVTDQVLPLRAVDEGVHMVAVLTDTQQVTVTYAPPVDKKGKPAQIQAGSLVWKVSAGGETFASVVPISEDPISARIVAGDPGICEVWPEADADLGDGVKTITGEHVGVQVTAGEATGISGPVIGVPEEQP